MIRIFQEICILLITQLFRKIKIEIDYDKNKKFQIRVISKTAINYRNIKICVILKK